MKIRLYRRIIIIFVLLSIIAGFWYIGYSRYIKYIGISLIPTSDIAARDINFYRQNDPAWSGDRLGDSSYKMGNAGCLITVIAAAMNELGIDIDPGRLNSSFSNNGAYTEDGDLIWYLIKEAVPQADYRYTRIFNNKTIEKDLQEGFLPLVNVRYHKNGITHWVMITGSINGEFLIYDPINQNQEYLPLSVHGRVYAYRVIISNSE